MADLVKKDLFSLEWFARSSFAGIDAAMHNRPTVSRHEQSLIRNLVLNLLDAEKAEADFRLSPMLSFYAFCQPLVRRSYAQILQDLWVLYMLGLRRGGYFVEFGACDGRTLSNTRLLEESYGWTGILAEPNPVWHEALATNRKAVVDLRCVAARSGEMADFLSTDAMPELSRMADIVPDDVHEHNGNRTRQTLYKVPTVSLDDLLAEHGAPDIIDYLSVDTEGSEYEILRHTNLNRRRFRLISVEHAGETVKRDQIFTLLEAAGYRRWMPELSRWDDWYVHQDDLGRAEPTLAH
ncbi:FkbM family methyltransferase [Loktanella sp. SALINAS62]|uniref:FkbM family methyltransferase n=1 Tax=Loktanella sp. SALINAS62 TaxID=2706124 RepID=UPI001B8CC5B1|nr:FkbM family methyltransferase [Loktanella sp. SALINAS62]MBS1301788.1 FkbM family methyltransferase [Loktanella sp. SALINAS62]